MRGAAAVWFWGHRLRQLTTDDDRLASRKKLFALAQRKRILSGVPASSSAKEAFSISNNLESFSSESSRTCRGHGEIFREEGGSCTFFSHFSFVASTNVKKSCAVCVFFSVFFLLFFHLCSVVFKKHLRRDLPPRLYIFPPHAVIGLLLKNRCN